MQKIKYWNKYKYLQLGKNQADLRNPCAYKKSGGFTESLRLQKIRRTIESLRALKSPRLVKNPRLKKNRRDWKSRQPAYCLGSAESPAADFFLVWLKSSRSDPRRCEWCPSHAVPKGGEGSGCPAFMGGLSPILYRLLVPAHHAKIHAEIQKLGGCLNFHLFLPNH